MTHLLDDRVVVARRRAELHSPQNDFKHAALRLCLDDQLVAIEVQPGNSETVRQRDSETADNG